MTGRGHDGQGRTVEFHQHGLLDPHQATSRSASILDLAGGSGPAMARWRSSEQGHCASLPAGVSFNRLENRHLHSLRADETAPDRC